MPRSRSMAPWEKPGDPLKPSYAQSNNPTHYTPLPRQCWRLGINSRTKTRSPMRLSTGRRRLCLSALSSKRSTTWLFRCSIGSAASHLSSPRHGFITEPTPPGCCVYARHVTHLGVISCLGNCWQRCNILPLYCNFPFSTLMPTLPLECGLFGFIVLVFLNLKKTWMSTTQLDSCSSVWAAELALHCEDLTKCVAPTETPMWLWQQVSLRRFFCFFTQTYVLFTLNRFWLIFVSVYCWSAPLSVSISSPSLPTRLQRLPQCPQWEQLKLSGATSQWHFNDSTAAPHTERRERYEHLLKIGPSDPTHTHTHVHSHSHVQTSEPPFVSPATGTVGGGWSLIKIIRRETFVYACVCACVHVIPAWHHHHLPGTAIIAGTRDREQRAGLLLVAVTSWRGAKLKFASALFFFWQCVGHSNALGICMWSPSDPYGLPALFYILLAPYTSSIWVQFTDL